MDAAYNRGVAVRARELLRNATDPEARETLKAIIKIFDQDCSTPNCNGENPPRHKKKPPGCAAKACASSVERPFPAKGMPAAHTL